MIAGALFSLAVAIGAAGQSSDASPAPVSTPDCTLIDGAEASSILGYTVGDPDAVSLAGGTCFFISRSASEDGTLSYAIVTDASLPERRAYFRAYSIRCAPAAKGTLNELACRQFLALAQADDLDSYYAARAAAGDVMPVSGLGDAAVASGSGLYVRRGGAVYEVSVVRGGDFDLERSEKLARELLARAKPV
jgi:hypothetical protein